MRDGFCGWYFKCQSEARTLAVIPAVHRSGGKRSCSIQLLTDRDTWNVPFPYAEFRKSRTAVEIGKIRFGEQGIHLELHAPGLTAAGILRFGPFTPLRYDIMGPFRWVPLMECRHSVWSMKHTVDGEVDINGVPYVFRGGTGYLEGDRGRSFPRVYAWTQCGFPEGALMLAAAEIPLGGLHFTGIIGAVLRRGREYRLATYLGARAECIGEGEIVIRQGSACLTVRQLEKTGRPLRAPAGGAMTRTIHEHPACRIYYRFQKDGETLFALEAPNAAFEYEYPC